MKADSKPELGDEDKSVFNPFVFIPTFFRILLHAPFTCLATAGFAVIWVLGSFELAQLGTLSTGISARSLEGVAGGNTNTNTNEMMGPYEMIQRDLAIEKNWFKSLSKKWNLTSTEIFYLVNLWTFICIPIFGLLIYLSVERSDPNKSYVNAWWKHPIRSVRKVRRSLTLFVVKLWRFFKFFIIVLGMEARFSGFFHKATILTYLRIIIYLAQLSIVILFNYEALNLTLIASGHSDGTHQGPDTKAISKAAQSLKSGVVEYMWHGIIPFDIIILTASWYVLVHGRTGEGGRFRILGGSTAISTVRAIGAVIIILTFTLFFILFSDIVKYTGKISPFWGAFVFLGVASVPMGWAVMVLEDLVAAFWRKIWCRGKDSSSERENSRAEKSKARRVEERRGRPRRR